MQNNKWIKWYHEGVPDALGEPRELIRTILAFLGHCKKCTALSGCYFVSDNKPKYPQHSLCDCELFPINVTENNLNADCDIRKFTEYIFRLDNNHGKTYIFEDWGYNIGDSDSLKTEFEKQAKDKYFNGEYQLQVADEYGQRITIEISLQDKEKNVRMIKTGWMVRPLGLITCSTPFSGVAK